LISGATCGGIDNGTAKVGMDERGGPGGKAPKLQTGAPADGNDQVAKTNDVPQQDTKPISLGVS
jgi:hypothetical protein